MKKTAQPADVSTEIISKPIITTDADRKFILALVVIVAFIIMLIIPLAMNETTLFTTVATALSGLVGTIIGYYFGSEKTPQQTTTPPTQ